MLSLLSAEQVFRDRERTQRVRAADCIEYGVDAPERTPLFTGIWERGTHTMPLRRYLDVDMVLLALRADVSYLDYHRLLVWATTPLEGRHVHALYLKALPARLSTDVSFQPLPCLQLYKNGLMLPIAAA